MRLPPHILSIHNIENIGTRYTFAQRQRNFVLSYLNWSQNGLRGDITILGISAPENGLSTVGSTMAQLSTVGHGRERPETPLHGRRA